MKLTLQTPSKSAALSPDGSTLAVLSKEGLVLLSTADGKPMRTIAGAFASKDKMDRLLWASAEVLVNWHHEALMVLTLSPAGVSVKTLAVEALLAAAVNPAGTQAVIARRNEDEGARLERVELASLSVHPVTEVDAFSGSALAWEDAGIVVWTGDMHVGGVAKLFSPEGALLKKAKTSRLGSFPTALGVLAGELAVFAPSTKEGQTLLFHAGKTHKLAGHGEPAALSSAAGLASLGGKVVSLPDGKKVAKLPGDEWSETLLSRDGRVVVGFDFDGEELALETVTPPAQPKAGSASVAATPSAPPSLEGQYGALLLGRALDVELTLAEVKKAQKAAAKWSKQSGLPLVFINPFATEDLDAEETVGESFFAGLLVAVAQDGEGPVTVDKAQLAADRLEAIPPGLWKDLGKLADVDDEDEDAEEDRGPGFFVVPGGWASGELSFGETKRVTTSSEDTTVGVRLSESDLAHILRANEPVLLTGRYI